MVKAVYTGSEFLDSTIPHEEVGIVLETTSFYAEQGGQVIICFVLDLRHMILSDWLMLYKHLPLIFSCQNNLVAEIFDNLNGIFYRLLLKYHFLTLTCKVLELTALCLVDI